MPFSKRSLSLWAHQVTPFFESEEIRLLRILTDQQLYKIDKHTHLGKLQPLFRQPIDWDLIKERYDQLFRVAASLKNRTAPAHNVLKRLRNSTPSDKMAKALTALGRVVKTIYILRYRSDENLRCRVQRQLNRGEFRSGDYAKTKKVMPCSLNRFTNENVNLSSKLISQNNSFD